MIRPFVFVALCALALAGCGSKSNAVTGKVTYNNQPVTGGSVTFLPINASAGDPKAAGKPAAANVQPDGTYRMAPGSDSGGAVQGQHRVLYSPPVAEVPEGTQLQPGQGPPPSPFDGLRPKLETVEVKAGKNSIDIELTK